MKYTILTLTLLLSITITWSAEYYIASGTTPVFTLAPGKKSGTLPVRMVQSFEHRKLSISAAKGSVNITLPFEKRMGSSEISFYNMTGKLVYRKTDYRESSFSLPTARFANGIYFVRVLVAGKSYHRFDYTVRRK